MSTRFITINNGYYTGVYDLMLNAWRVEPEYTWKQAAAMTAALNKNSQLEPEELNKILLGRNNQEGLK